MMQVQGYSGVICWIAPCVCKSLTSYLNKSDTGVSNAEEQVNSARGSFAISSKEKLWLLPPAGEWAHAQASDLTRCHASGTGSP